MTVSSFFPNKRWEWTGTDCRHSVWGPELVLHVRAGGRGPLGGLLYTLEVIFSRVLHSFFLSFPSYVVSDIIIFNSPVATLITGPGHYCPERGLMTERWIVTGDIQHRMIRPID